MELARGFVKKLTNLEYLRYNVSNLKTKQLYGRLVGLKQRNVFKFLLN